jgi:hypothetical protein
MAFPLPAGGQDETEAAGEAEADLSLWEQVQKLYEAAKAAGEKVPRDIYEWVRQDLESGSRWEYKVLELESAAAAALEEGLNTEGAEGWECFWVQPAARGKTRFLMKRPGKSYLRQLPLGQLIRFVPGGNADGG